MRSRKLRITMVIFWGIACALLGAGRTPGSVGGIFCVVPNRAIVVYANELHVLEPGTKIITESSPTKRDAQIAGRLPENVRLFDLLTISMVPGVIGRKTLDAWEMRDNKLTPAYLALTKEKRITIVRGRREDNANWSDWQVQHLRVAPNWVNDDEGYESRTFVFESVADEKASGRFITVSTEKTVINDREGKPMVLHPLVLGSEKDAAKFQTIDFPEISGK